MTVALEPDTIPKRCTYTKVRVVQTGLKYYDVPITQEQIVLV